MALTLEKVSTRYDSGSRRGNDGLALHEIDLAVRDGEHIAVIGPSGAGKTTLLQLLACASRPVSGRFEVDGVAPWSLPTSALQRLRGTLFLAPQVPPLPPRQRVVTAVLAGRLPTMGAWASLRSLFHPIDIPAAHDALGRFDLADKLFERVDRLSGGERQRVGLARALVSPARLWLVDEPLSSLDPTRADQALSALIDSARERGVTVITSLHQVDAALAAFPRIVGLRDGRIAFDLPASQVSRDHLARLYAQDFPAQALATQEGGALDRPAPSPEAEQGQQVRTAAMLCR